MKTHPAEPLASLGALCNTRCMNESLIGTAEAATLLGVDKATITRWAQSGRLPIAARVSASPNAAMLFRRADVERVKAGSAA